MTDHTITIDQTPRPRWWLDLASQAEPTALPALLIESALARQAGMRAASAALGERIFAATVERLIAAELTRADGSIEEIPGRSFFNEHGALMTHFDRPVPVREGDTITLLQRPPARAPSAPDAD